MVLVGFSGSNKYIGEYTGWNHAARMKSISKCSWKMAPNGERTWSNNIEQQWRGAHLEYTYYILSISSDIYKHLQSSIKYRIYINENPKCIFRWFCQRVSTKSQVGACAEVCCQKIVLGFPRLKLGFVARNLLPRWQPWVCYMEVAIHWMEKNLKEIFRRNPRDFEWFWGTNHKIGRSCAVNFCEMLMFIWCFFHDAEVADFEQPPDCVNERSIQLFWGMGKGVARIVPDMDPPPRLDVGDLPCPFLRMSWNGFACAMYWLPSGNST